MAAQGTASYAAGDIVGLGRGLGDESRTLKGKRRRTVFSPAAKPLFAAEAEFRASKAFRPTRSKKGMLALYGTDLQVVDVAGLDGAADGSGLATDVTSHVLRWVNIADVSNSTGARPTAHSSTRSRLSQPLCWPACRPATLHTQHTHSPACLPAVLPAAAAGHQLLWPSHTAHRAWRHVRQAQAAGHRGATGSSQ